MTKSNKTLVSWMSVIVLLNFLGWAYAKFVLVKELPTQSEISVESKLEAVDADTNQYLDNVLSTKETAHDNGSK